MRCDSIYIHISYDCAGNGQGLIPDRQVRVSVKALALGCIGSALMLCPAAFVGKLHVSSPTEGKRDDRVIGMNAIDPISSFQQVLNLYRGEIIVSV